MTDAEEFDGAFAAALKDGVEGLVALRDPVIIMNRARLPALAAKYIGCSPKQATPGSAAV